MTKKKKRKLPAKLCGANLTTGPGTCGHSAGWSTEHNGRGRCSLHGGNTPTHLAHCRRVALQEAVETFGLPREIEPTDALLEEVHRTAGIVRWLQLEVQAQDAAELAVKQGELLRLYRVERRHHVRVCQVAIAAGIAERQVRVAEQHAAMFAAALRGMFEDLGVADHPKLGKIVRRHLTLLDGGKAA